MEKIILNDGMKDHEFKLLDTFGVEDQEYAEGDEAVFQTIENKKEFDEILALYVELLDEYQEEQ